jgi:uncharacterized protein
MILIPFFVLFITEILKTIIQSIRCKKFDIGWFLHSGGMPSGHASFTSSIATITAYINGYNSTEFLIAGGFAILIMYDARGLRAHVGTHAKTLNKLTKKDPLDEFIGHTNWQVIIGCTLGISLSIIGIQIFQYVS